MRNYANPKTCRVFFCLFFSTLSTGLGFLNLETKGTGPCPMCPCLNWTLPLPPLEVWCYLIKYVWTFTLDLTIHWFCNQFSNDKYEFQYEYDSNITMCSNHLFIYFSRSDLSVLASVRHAMAMVSSLSAIKDSRWLQLEVCREFQRNKCSRSDTDCKFAHPPSHVEVQNGRVIACYDSIKVFWFLSLSSAFSHFVCLYHTYKKHMVEVKSFLHRWCRNWNLPEPWVGFPFLLTCHCGSN